MTKIKRLVAIALALLMVFGSMSVMASAVATISTWDATVDDGFDLGITTKIYREVDGEWVETEKVKAGEAVKARVFIDTDYFTNTGSLLFFYNTSFFSDAYSSDLNDLKVNPYYSQKPYYFKGSFYNKSAGTGIENVFVNAGVISRDFANTHNYFSISYEIEGNNKNKLISGSKWFCEFDLTVNADAAGTGKFYAIDGTVLTPSFSRGYINVTKGPSYGYVENVVSMADWKANVTLSDVPVTLYKNYVEATFKAGNGMFESTNEDTAVYSGEANSALAVEAPIRENYIFEGWVAEGTSDAPAEVIAFPAADTTYVASWRSATDYDETLSFKTDFYRLDEETGEWVYTEKVIPGETVKARLYINTTYFTNAGNLIMFYDNDFFDTTYTENVEYTLVTNTDPNSSAKISGATGTFTLADDNNAVVNKLLTNGYISQDFVDTHEAITAVYTFNPALGQKLSGEYYFAEWEFQVKEDATGEGDFFIVEDTIQNANESRLAHISVHMSTDGGKDTDAISLFEINLNTEVESHPVSTYSKITFDANGGAFDAADPDIFVIEGDIKDPVDAATIPEISRDGYTFKGWVPAEIAEPTVADVVEVPAEIPFDELELKALWIKHVDITFVNGNGEPDTVITVTAGDAFEAPAEPELEGHYFVGWTPDPDANPMELGLPATYPETDTTYTAVFETYTYVVEYYVLNPETGAFENVSESNVAYGEEINLVPTAYTAPEGYTLSPAYKDITFETLATAGETMPAGGTKLYFQLIANEYDAVFKLDGGNIDGDTADVVVKTTFGDPVKAPANPVKEGHTFMGWSPMVGNMDEEGLEFVATWEVNTYYAEYIVEGKTYEKYDIPYGALMEKPADPELEGYIFKGWSPDVAETMPAEDVVYTAVFEADKFDVTFDLNEGNVDGNTDDVVVETTYGEAINAPVPVRPGYTFAGWDPTLPETMPAEDFTVTARWDANKDTPYTIIIKTMKTDGTYDKKTYDKTGTTDELVELDVNITDGFELNAADSVLSDTIKADGSTTLIAVYDRVKYTIVFDANGGAISGEATVSNEYPFMATVVAPADPTRRGYTFKGWDKNVEKYATEDATYTAQWEANPYDIIYMSEDEEFTRESFKFEAPVTETILVPEKFGYTFSYWTNSSGDAYSFPATMPATNITVYAAFTANPYDANFFADADDTTPFDSFEVTFDQPINAPANEPTKEGYVFEGWSTDGETVLDDLGMMDAEGKDFIAVWSEDDVNYTVDIYYQNADGTYPTDPSDSKDFTAKTNSEVTYTPDEVKNYEVDAELSILEGTVAADGSLLLEVYYAREINKIIIDVDGEITEKEYPYGADVDPIPDPEDKEGHKFAGWVDENGDPVEIPETMPEDNVTIKADWDVLSYNVTFIVDKEVYDGPTATKYGSTLTLPSNPTKAGYSFGGWFDADGKQPSDYGTMPAKNLEFTAQWKANANVGYVLEIYEMDAEGNYPADPTTTLNFNDGVVNDERTVSVNVPTGFKLSASSTLTGTIPATGTLVLKAYLEREKYTITFDIDGTIVEEEYYYGEVVTADPDTDKKGWTFVEWIDTNTDAARDIPVNMPAENVSLKATWTKDSFAANFDAGEGAFPSTGKSTETVNVPFAEFITAPDEEPTRDGYVFEGWALPENPDVVVDNFGRMSEDGAEFVAVWSKDEYIVKFYDYLPSEFGPAVSDEMYVYDQQINKFEEEITFPEDPSYEHYVFIGWVDENGIPVEVGATTPVGGMNIYAKYERVKVMLIPKNDTCTTVIDREGLTVDDYTEDSLWYVYGLEELMTRSLLLEEYIDVQGDGRIVVTKYSTVSQYYGTGSRIDVYDNVTNELVESFTIIIFGDVDGNSYVNAGDVSIVNNEVLGLTGWSVEGLDEYKHFLVKAANIRSDYFIDIADMNYINLHTLGMETINQVEGKLESAL